ncbi:MAG: QueT transporter family protein [Lachnospiraceae bacterium]|nr:QueT transporter family protein [Lachnospiraceae bacterium]
MKRNKYATLIPQAAMIAALYVVLTLVASAFGLDRYAVQLRFSEALTILPFFTPAAIPGLYAGCLLANLLTGCIIWDVIFGPVATLLGAVGTYLLRRHSKWLAPLPAIVSNTLIIPFILIYAYHFEGALPYFMVTVGLGEIASCGLLGMILLFTLEKHRGRIFS